MVVDLVKHTVNKVKNNQKIILLEGFCNSNKLSKDDDRLEMRFMDELFMIEKYIGEV